MSDLSNIAYLTSSSIFIDRFCLNIGWLYTHLVAANSGIIVSLNSPEAYLMDDAHDAVNGIEQHDRQHPSPNSSTDSPTEISRLLSSPLSERLNESIQTFMAMFVLFLIMSIRMYINLSLYVSNAGSYIFRLSYWNYRTFFLRHSTSHVLRDHSQSKCIALS